MIFAESSHLPDGSGPRAKNRNRVPSRNSWSLTIMSPDPLQPFQSRRVLAAIRIYVLAPLMPRGLFELPRAAEPEHPRDDGRAHRHAHLHVEPPIAPPLAALRRVHRAFRHQVSGLRIE